MIRAKILFENNESRFLKGEKQSEIIKENGHRFYVNWFEGQKTGFLLISVRTENC